jgi:hypothetical protein
MRRIASTVEEEVSKVEDEKLPNTKHNPDPEKPHGDYFLMLGVARPDSAPFKAKGSSVPVGGNTTGEDDTSQTSRLSISGSD